jgi:hypothetical protein
VGVPAGGPRPAGDLPLGQHLVLAALSLRGTFIEPDGRLLFGHRAEQVVGDIVALHKLHCR